MATQTLINSCKVTNIINIGSCGAIKPNVHLNNVIIPKIVSYFDIDLTAFGYEPNRLPHLPVQFKIDQALIKKIRKILQPLNYKISHDELVTGETFINQNNFKNFKISKNAIVVDMEGAAIVQTCKHNNIPCVIIKIVSDSIFDKNKNEISWKNNILPISKIINQTFSSLVFKL
jgi:adenosylhomocysteine nucleosidase